MKRPPIYTDIPPWEIEEKRDDLRNDFPIVTGKIPFLGTPEEIAEAINQIEATQRTAKKSQKR